MSRASLFPFLLVCALLLQIPSPVLLADEQPVSVKNSVDKPKVTVGEPVRYVVTVRHPKGMSIEREPPAFENFEIDDLGSEPPQRENGFMTQTNWTLLSSTVIGSHEVPSPTVAYIGSDGVRHEVRGNPVSVTVKSLLPTDWESQDIKDIKPPVPIRHRPWIWGFILLALLAGAVFAWKRLKRSPVSQKEREIPTRPAHEIALDEMGKLRQEDLPSRGLYEQYYVRLSGIVRRYIENRFGLRVPEMTTEEFLQNAVRAQAILSGYQLPLKEFLIHCDMVKFARYQPSPVEAREAFSSAERFVKETRSAEESENGKNGFEGSTHPASRADFLFPDTTERWFLRGRHDVP